VTSARAGSWPTKAFRALGVRQGRGVPAGGPVRQTKHCTACCRRNWLDDTLVNVIFEVGRADATLASLESGGANSEATAMTEWSNPVVADNPRWAALVDVGALLALGAADIYGLVPFSRTPFVIILAWLSLRRRGVSWASIGFRLPERPWRAIAIGAVAGLAIETFSDLVTVPAIARITGVLPDMADMRSVVGSVPNLLIALTISWLLAAFGEEVAFRGHAFTRFAAARRHATRHGTGPGPVEPVLRDRAHTQGVTGIIQESFAGFLLALLYVQQRRNLVAPIVAHGMSNTVAFIAIVFGHYPGL